MGAFEVAKELDVAPTNLAKVSGLPPAATELERGRVWRADVIRKFAADRREAKAEAKRRAKERAKAIAAYEAKMKAKREARAKAKAEREAAKA